MSSAAHVSAEEQEVLTCGREFIKTQFGGCENNATSGKTDFDSWRLRSVGRRWRKARRIVLRVDCARGQGEHHSTFPYIFDMRHLCKRLWDVTRDSYQSVNLDRRTEGSSGLEPAVTLVANGVGTGAELRRFPGCFPGSRLTIPGRRFVAKQPRLAMNRG